MGGAFSSEKALNETFQLGGGGGAPAAVPSAVATMPTFLPTLTPAPPPPQDEFTYAAPPPPPSSSPPQTTNSHHPLPQQQQQQQLLPSPPQQTQSMSRTAKLVDRTAAAMLLDDVLRTCRTGDLLLLQGGGTWRDRVMRWCTWSRWSHVCVLDVASPSCVLLWEAVPSRPDGCLDILTRAEAAPDAGVRIVDARERIASHARASGLANGMFCVLAIVRLRFPHTPPYVQSQDHSPLRAMISSQMSAYQNRVHPTGAQAKRLAEGRRELGNLTAAASPLPHPNPSASELACETYKAMGILDCACDSSALCPDDFISRRDRLAFLHDFGLADEVYLYKVYCGADPFTTVPV